MEEEYQDILRRLGLLHLIDHPQALREELLRMMGLWHLRDRPSELSTELNRQLETEEPDVTAGTSGAGAFYPEEESDFEGRAAEGQKEIAALGLLQEALWSRRN